MGVSAVWVNSARAKDSPTALEMCTRQLRRVCPSVRRFGLVVIVLIKLVLHVGFLAELSESAGRR